MSSSNPATIKAIETRYAGCRFRSRLEARWAVFFDTLGIEWQYEPEGFVVDGRPYLPDFRITNNYRQRYWIEVKGDPARLDLDLVRTFAVAQDAEVMLLGSIPPAGMYAPSWVRFIGWPDMVSYLDSDEGPQGWERIMMTDRAWFDDYGRICTATTEAPSLEDFPAAWLTPVNDDDTPRMAQHAYIAARSARFEHGERG